MKKTNGFVLPLLLIIIALAVVGGAAYVYKNQLIQPAKTTTLNTVDQVSIPTLASTSIQTSSSASSSTLPSANYSNNFNIVSGDYKVNISVSTCDIDMCQGPGVVVLNNLKTNTVVQTFISTDLLFFKDSIHKIHVNETELYDSTGPLVFGDFNFDGTTDVAIRNGSEGGYGSPSYDVYLYANGRFTLNSELTDLASQNLGMFNVDYKNKTLIVFQKDGCCWHETLIYQVIGNTPKLIESIVEDATIKEGKVVVTDKKLVNGNWTTTTKEYDVDEYYKK